MNQYSEGLRHGWEDANKMVRGILERDLPDARKLELIAQQVESTPYAKMEVPS